MFLPIIRNKKKKAILLTGAMLMVFHRAVSYSGVSEEVRLATTVPVEAVGEVAIKPAAVKKVVAQSQKGIIEKFEPAVVQQKQVDRRAFELDKLVQPITTVTEFIGGQQERNRGSGFVVGNRFFTVHHNLTTSFPSLRVKSTSFIDGMSVTQPVFFNKEQDVAVFDLSDRLCVKHCNKTEVDYSPNLKKARKVYWLRKFQEDFILKEARIVGAVTFGDTHKPAGLSCGSQSVVLVDQPFIPGSSGSPLMDAETGKIIGVIQGSVDENGNSKGYFKPINCVLAMLAEAQSTRAIAKL